MCFHVVDHNLRLPIVRGKQKRIYIYIKDENVDWETLDKRDINSRSYDDDSYQIDEWNFVVIRYDFSLFFFRTGGWLRIFGLTFSFCVVLHQKNKVQYAFTLLIFEYTLILSTNFLFSYQHFIFNLLFRQLNENILWGNNQIKIFLIITW